MLKFVPYFFAALGLLSLAPAGAQQSRPVASQFVQLSGNTHPLTRIAKDEGALSGETSLHRLMLVLRRSPAQELALNQVLADQQDATSPGFHHWLTPQEFGVKFGPSDANLNQLITWLQTSGFTDVKLNPGRTVIELSGTERALEQAFHTSLHNYRHQGALYTANTKDPEVPAAFSSLLHGFSSLNNFPRKANSHVAGVFHRDGVTGEVTKLDSPTETKTPKPDYTYTLGTTTYYPIFPADFATIYNVNPLYQSSTPIDGTGQTIAIVGRTDIHDSDYVSFRTLAGLPLGIAPKGAASQYLNIIHNGVAPGVNGDEPEGNLDVQWASAIAPNALIDFVVSADSATTFGVDLSAQYVIDNNLAPVMSESYGFCEFSAGNATNAFFSNLWQQAAAQGITVMVSSGDSGSAGCDAQFDTQYPAQYGNAVNGIASTPWNVAVGGTDFNLPNSVTGYFSSTPGVNGLSSLAYPPEVPWNETCANPAFSEIPSQANKTPEYLCNHGTGQAGFVGVEGGGGGPSNCTTSTGATIQSCVSGYPKPAWQTGPGVPADNARDLPDVSLFAADGNGNTLFHAFYVICESDRLSNFQRSCDTSGVNGHDFVGIGGTSAASPSFAGIMALVNQKTGSRQGNANYVLYKLAAQQAASGATCSSSGPPSTNCIFHDLTYGSIAQPCASGTPNCVTSTPGDSVGILSGGNAGVGYDTASGLGSINVANLVNGWSNATLTPTATTLALSATNFVHGTAVTASVAVSSAAGTPSGDVSVIAATPNGNITVGTLDGAGKFTATVTSLPGGTYAVHAHYAGSPVYAQSDSAPVQVSVTPEPSTLRIILEEKNIATGAVTTLSGATQAYGILTALKFQVSGSSGPGVATGALTATDNGIPFDPSKLIFTAAGYVEDSSPSLTPGTHNLVASFPGDVSYAPSQGTASFTITKGPTVSLFQLYSPYTVSASDTVSVGALINTQSFGYMGPRGTIQFYAGNQLLAQTYALDIDDTWPYVGNNSAVFPASLLQLGANNVIVKFANDSNYADSVSAPVTITVTPSTRLPTVTTYTATPTTLASGTLINLSISVDHCTANSNSRIFYYVDGSAPLQIVPTYSDGGCHVNVYIEIDNTVGVHDSYAIYAGDPNYASSTSAHLPLTITSVPASLEVTASLSADQIQVAGPLTATATVTPSTLSGTLTLFVDSQYTQSFPIAPGSTTITATIPTATLNVGPHTVYFSFVGGPSASLQGGSPLESFTILGGPFQPTTYPSFTLTPASAAVTVTRGTTSPATTLTVSPANGFTGTVAFSCSGLPAAATCTFAPATLLFGSTAQSTTVTFNAIAQHAQMERHSPWKLSSGARLGIFLLGCLSPLAVRRRRSRLIPLVLAIAAFSSLASLSGCGSGAGAGTGSGGGNGGGSSPPTDPFTPAGTYSITITAVSVSLVHTTTVTLTVQ